MGGGARREGRGRRRWEGWEGVAVGVWEGEGGGSVGWGGRRECGLDLIQTGTRVGLNFWRPRRECDAVCSVVGALQFWAMENLLVAAFRR